MEFGKVTSTKKYGRVKREIKEVKFDQTTIEAILQDLRDEIPYLHACESNGIAYPTFLLWIDNGIKDTKDGLDTKYSQLLRAVRKIEKNRMKGHISKIKKEKKGHKGSEWIMERAFWKQFGSKSAEIELNERLEKLEQQGLNNNDEKENENTNGN